GSEALASQTDILTAPSSPLSASLQIPSILLVQRASTAAATWLAGYQMVILNTSDASIHRSRSADSALNWARLRRGWRSARASARSASSHVRTSLRTTV